jgi:hypothetical protein
MTALILVEIENDDARRSKIPMVNIYYNGKPIANLPRANVAHIMGDQRRAKALYDSDLMLFYEVRSEDHS